MDTQAVPYQPGVLLRGDQLSGGVSKKYFSLFDPFFKPLKIAFNFRLNPPFSILPSDIPEVNKVKVVFIHSIEQHTRMSTVYSLPSCLVQELR